VNLNSFDKSSGLKSELLLEMKLRAPSRVGGAEHCLKVNRNGDRRSPCACAHYPAAQQRQTTESQIVAFKTSLFISQKSGFTREKTAIFGKIMQFANVE